MPTYDYRCDVCGDTQTKNVKISERDDYNGRQCLNCDGGTYSRVVVSPRIVSGVGEIYSKTPHGFRDILKEMKKNAGKHSTIEY